MRDAFGGAFSIKLMLIFLMLYVAFICVALNYARAFRVKNRIINIIEQYEGYCGVNKEQINNDINTYLSKTGYYISKDDVVGDEDALDSDKEASEDTQEGTDGLAKSDIKKNDSETLEEGNSKKQSMNRVVINEEFGLPEVSIDPNAVD